jgi:hypothetical protein
LFRRTGGVVDLAEVVLDAAWDGDHQHPGLAFSGVESMREPARQEDEAARAGFERLVAARHRHGPVEDVKALVLVRMDMTRRPLPDDRLHHGQRAGGGRCRGLHVRTVSGDPLTWARNVSSKIRHEPDYGSSVRARITERQGNAGGSVGLLVPR